MKQHLNSLSKKRGLSSIVGGASVLCGVCMSALVHANVTNYDAFKTGLFQQATANPSFSQGDAAFWYFNARIFLDTGTDAASGTVNYPGPASPLTLTQGAGPILSGGNSNSFSTLAAMDAAYPGGTYNYAISGGSLGADSASLTLSDSHEFPNSIPTFSNFTNITTGVNPSADFAFQWNPFLTNPSASYSAVFLNIVDATTFATVANSGALPSGTTSFNVSALTLAPNHSYNADLFFSSRGINGTGFGGLSGLVGEDYVTEVKFSTVPLPAGLPLLGSALTLVIGLFGRGPRRAPRS